MKNTFFLALNIDNNAIQSLISYTAKHGQTVEQAIQQALEEWALNRSIHWPDQS